MKLGLIVLSLLLVVSLSGGTAQAQFPDPCASSAALLGGPTFVFASCPRGDGLPPSANGWGIWIRVVDLFGLPFAGIPPTDIWLDGCFSPIVPCVSGPASRADNPTDANGETAMSQFTFAVSGCGGNGAAIDPNDAVRVMVMGIAIQNIFSGCADLCLPVEVRSVDLVPNGVVDLPDLSRFAQAYLGTISGECSDFNGNGTVNLPDFGFFATHFVAGHSCTP